MEENGRKSDAEYMEIFNAQMQKFGELCAQRNSIQEEIDRLEQLIAACYNMLSEENQKNFSETIGKIGGTLRDQEIGLTEAIRTILQSNTKQGFTPIQIRDRLQADGFDFGMYTSNPLSSVHSVLKRFKPNQVKAVERIDGKTYRWVGRLRPTMRIGTIFRHKGLKGLGGLAFQGTRTTTTESVVPQPFAFGIEPVPEPPEPPPHGSIRSILKRGEK